MYVTVLILIQALQELEKQLNEFNQTLNSNASQQEQRSRDLAEKQHAVDVQQKEAEFTSTLLRETEGFAQTTLQQKQQLAKQHHEEWQELKQRHQAETDRLQKRHLATEEEYQATKASKRATFEAEIAKEQRDFVEVQEQEVKELIGHAIPSAAGGGAGSEKKTLQTDLMFSLKKQIAQRQLALIDQIATEEATIRVNAWSKAQDKLTTKSA